MKCVCPAFVAGLTFVKFSTSLKLSSWIGSVEILDIQVISQGNNTFKCTSIS